MDELRSRLTNMDEERERLSAELETLRDASRRKEQTDAMLEAFLEIRQDGEYFYNDSPEERRKAYSRLSARFTVDQDGILRLRLELSGNIEDRCTPNGSSWSTPPPRPRRFKGGKRGLTNRGRPRRIAPCSDATQN